MNDDRFLTGEQNLSHSGIVEMDDSGNTLSVESLFETLRERKIN